MMGRKYDLLDETENFLKTELIELQRKGTPEKPAASLTDKMKVVDRILKIAAIKAKLNDSEFGAGFRDDEDDR